MRLLKKRALFSIFASVGALLLAVPSAAFAASGSAGSGETETEVTNSLSVPAIIVGDSPFTLSCGTDAPGEYIAPSGEPSTGYEINPEAYYYVQGTNAWQAQCMTALTATATVDWGDNLSGDASLVVGHPIRVEIGLLADIPPSMTGLTVEKLQPSVSDKDSVYGTLATSSDAGYVANPVTPYSEVRVWDSGAKTTITDPKGNVLDVTMSGEVNATGRIVYGLLLTRDYVGPYTVTFTPSSNVTLSSPSTTTFYVVSSTGDGSSSATLPGAPTNVQAAAGSGRVTLSWVAPAAIGSGTLSGYNVFMGTAPGAESTTPVNTSLVAGTTYTVTGLTGGTTYYFTVQTVTTVGSSVSSNEVSATASAAAVSPVSPVIPFIPSVPSTPSSPSASASPGSGTGAGVAAGSPGTKAASATKLSLTASPAKLHGISAVTYKVKVAGARGGTVLIKAGSRLVCTIHLDTKGQGQCTSARWTGQGIVTATYKGDATHAGSSARVKTIAVPASYWLVGANGSVLGFGGAPKLGSLPGNHVQASNILGLVGAADGQGYWMVARDGKVFGFGSAHVYGSLAGKVMKSPVVGMAPTADGKGYWLTAANGGVFAFGSAHFYGSLGAKKMKSPVVGISSTATGKGYWLTAANGGVFTFGDAHFYGSLGGKAMKSPIASMAVTPDGHGYWLVSRDGRVSEFGNAVNFGSPRALAPGNAVVGIAAW